MVIVETNEYLRWYNKLKDSKAKARIDVRLRRIATQEHFGDCKSVGDSIFELRIDYGPGYRVYYTQRGEEIILLLIGGDKSTQQSDIDKAKKILAEQ
jgi:putative addiction module killer protein